LKCNWIITFALVASFFLLGFLVMLDQYMQIGLWIQWQDLFHHETFALAFFAVGVGIFIGSISQAILRAVEQL
jgi:hypothetical protein